jgi:hypothetical protein
MKWNAFWVSGSSVLEDGPLQGIIFFARGDKQICDKRDLCSCGTITLALIRLHLLITE